VDKGPKGEDICYLPPSVWADFRPYGGCFYGRRKATRGTPKIRGAGTPTLGNSQQTLSFPTNYGGANIVSNTPTGECFEGKSVARTNHWDEVNNLKRQKRTTLAKSRRSHGTWRNR